MRKLIALGILAGVVWVAAVIAMPADGKPRGQNGRIAFALFDPALDGPVTYTANPDGSHVKQLYFAAPSGEPHWSPDGSQIAILAPCTDGEENCGVTLVNPDTGDFRQHKMPDPNLFTACIVWSPDGKRLACEGFGEPDPSRNGIYTVRSSDGRGLTRMTSNPGGDDLPVDYSPDGKRLVFARFDENGESVGLYVVKTNGSGLRRITPPGTIFTLSAMGDWSPQGNTILFGRRVNAGRRTSLWVVHSNGTGLREIKLQARPACGGPISDPASRGCIHPRWSPDGKKIIFTSFTTDAEGEVENVYSVNADGSGLTQITQGGASDGTADWGTHPLIP
jgi:TolB protein